MRPLAILMPALMFLTSSCGGGGDAKVIVPQDDAGPGPNGAAPIVANSAKSPANETATPLDVPDDPALTGLSPSRRRAYDRGYRDCAAGRYDPDRYPESYRIGCAAAHDR